MVALMPMLLVLNLPDVDQSRLRATVEKLSSYNTRNTNTPELLHAANWLADEFRKIPGMQVELMPYTVEAGRRILATKEVVQVVATLPGRTDRRIIIGGHLDSYVVEGDPMTANAPGANDDASGVALTLEIARLMAGKQWENTLVFVGFTGEEQGLLGSTALAKRATAEGWTIDAVLSNDTVGSSGNKNKQSNKKQVRVFSDESPDHESRELARYVEWVGRQKMKGFGAKLVLRADRFGRGGDHTPFARENFNAVRFIEVHEEYTRQHTTDDLIEHMDFGYLENVARLNLAVATELASAAPQPTDVRIDRAQGHDTHLTWTALPGVRYVVFWRDTGSPAWQKAHEVGAVGEAVIQKVNKDDHFFAVGAVGGLPVAAR
jgi:hypothetical protein